MKKSPRLKPDTICHLPSRPHRFPQSEAIVGIVGQRLPPDRELQHPVRALDEDQGFLPAAVQGGSIDVDELVAHLELLAHGRLPAVLNLRGKHGKGQVC